MWELVRKAKANSRSRPYPRTTESETLERDPLICIEKALQVIPMQFKFQNALGYSVYT